MTRVVEPELKLFYSYRVRACHAKTISLGLAGFLLAAMLSSCTGDPESVASSTQANSDDRGTVILLSIDGFGWDFADRFDTPNLQSIAERGAKADALVPVYPTLTFPNHYSIATGALPSRHGIVANDFPDENREHWYKYKDRSTVQDGRWYLSEPIWVTAERHGLRTASFYFVGTEADVGGIRPQEWRAFDAKITGQQRVDQVLEWLRQPVEQRPRLVTLYFNVVDDYSHWYGVGSEESRKAIADADALIGRLLEGLKNSPVSDSFTLIVVSDHGQASAAGDRPVFVLDENLAEQGLDLDGIHLVDGGPYVNFWFNEDETERMHKLHGAINAQWDCGRALLKSEMPPGWNVTDSLRFPDMVAQADENCAVISSRNQAEKNSPGDHGWPPETRDMHGIFFALGPRIRPGSRVEAIRVVDVYPLMLELLGLPAPGPNDADPSALRRILVDP